MITKMIILLTFLLPKNQFPSLYFDRITSHKAELTLLLFVYSFLIISEWKYGILFSFFFFFFFFGGGDDLHMMVQEK